MIALVSGVFTLENIRNISELASPEYIQRSFLATDQVKLQSGSGIENSAQIKGSMLH